MTGNENISPSVTPMHTARNILKEEILRMLKLGCFVDVAFIGTTSDIYEWSPCKIIDYDVALFVKAIDNVFAGFLEDLSTKMRSELLQIGMDFELKCVRGPYKPTPSQIERPILCAHCAVFTEATYIEESKLLRYGWRKYSCQNESTRLNRLSPPRLLVRDLIREPLGILDRLLSIVEGKVKMQERDLHSLEWRTLIVEPESPLFAEYCIDSGATIARSHARVIGKKEADSLGNDQFFNWYNKYILRSESLVSLIVLKKIVRQKGYSGSLPMAKKMALKYLGDVLCQITDDPWE